MSALAFGDFLRVLVGQNAVIVRLLAVVLTRFRIGQHLFDNQTGIGADGTLDLGGGFGVFLEIRFGVLAALADAIAIVGKPCA
jgi:hypothetical protein